MRNSIKKIVLMLLLMVSTSLFTQRLQFKSPKKKKLFNKELVFPKMISEHEKLTTSQLDNISHEIDLINPDNKILNNQEETEHQLVYKEFDKINGCVLEYAFNKSKTIFGVTRLIKIVPDGNENMESSFYYTEGKAYYLDGNLKAKWLRFQSGSNGLITLKEFRYDEKGKLIKEFDISKIYRLSLIDVLKILEKNNLSIDFDKASVSAGGISHISFIWHKETNHGKIWIVGNGLENFHAIIYDENGDILIKKDLPSQKVFLSMEKWLFDDTYKGKTVEEVEKETGLKIFVYEQ